MAINFPVKELEKFKHIESYARQDKTLAEYKPHFWSDKRYIVAVLKRQQGKKGKSGREYYEPIYQSTSLDSSLFAYNNVHILDVMSMKRQKTLLKMRTEKGENLEKKFLLEADFDEQGNPKLQVAKFKDLKVNIIQVENPDELCLE